MQYLQNIITYIVNPAIDLLLGIAILYFVYGVFKFVTRSGEADGRAEGARHILYSTIGIFIMVSVFGIMAAIQNSFNLH